MKPKFNKKLLGKTFKRAQKAVVAEIEKVGYIEGGSSIGAQKRSQLLLSQIIEDAEAGLALKATMEAEEKVEDRSHRLGALQRSSSRASCVCVCIVTRSA